MVIAYSTVFRKTNNINDLNTSIQTYSRKGDMSRGKQPRSYDKVPNNN